MSFRRLLEAPCALLLVLFALLPVAAGDARAQGSAFLVGGIPVDARAETATLARESAIAQGQGRAFDTLMRRLVVREDLSRVPRPDAATLANLVQGFSVADEKTSSGRYLAKFTVQFKPNSIRALLRQARVRFAETVSRPLLIFPVFGKGDSAVIWQEPNPWRAAWARATTRGGLVPVEVPLGDLSDMGAVTASQALAGDKERLAAIAQRYGASDIMVAHASLQGGDLQVESLQGRPGSLSSAPSVGFQQQGGESRDQFMARAVEDTIARLENAWKRRNAIDYSAQSVLRVSVPFSTIGQWAEIRRRLGGVPALVSSSVTRLKRDQADLTMTVVGNLDQFVQVLAQRSLILKRSATASATQAATQAGQGATPSPSGAAASAPAPTVTLTAPKPEWELRLAGAVPTSGGQSGGTSSSGGSGGQNFIERVEDDGSTQ